MQKDKIQLYQNQVFVTDNVEGIVPEFLTLLRGVIDSPDIPLNVSRSYLQADGAVKKISNYITRKVADKLNSLYKKDRKGFEDKFFEKAQKFALYPTVNNEYFTFEELKEKISKTQTDKDGNLIILYASNINEQHSYVESAKAKGYEVLLLDSPIISHLIQKIETSNEKLNFTRVDSDVIDKLIKKDEKEVSKLDDKEKEKLKTIIEEVVPKEKYTVQIEAIESSSPPFVITVPEFMRRMKEMQQSGGNGMFGNMPEMYNLIINVNNPICSDILNSKGKAKKERLINQSLDLAKLSQNLLKGEELTSFIKRSLDLIK
jgi:molecular chaperone HtpG